LIEVVAHYQNGQAEKKIISPPFLIGSGVGCELRIVHWKVAKRHLRISRSSNGIFAEDLGGLLGTLINDRRIATFGPIKSSDQIIVGPCLIQLSNARGTIVNESEVIQESPIEQGLTNLSFEKNQTLSSCRDHTGESICMSLFTEMQLALMKSFEIRKRDITLLSEASLVREARSYLNEQFQSDKRFRDSTEFEHYVTCVVDESLRFGPISELLCDPTISEIMVNRFDQIYIERHGQISPLKAKFTSELALKVVLDRMIAPVGRRIDDASPMVDARLVDGSRLNAVLSSVSIRGLTLTIRKFHQRSMVTSDLIRSGFFDHKIANFLFLAVQKKLNILISGGTSSGKTTLLNIIARQIPSCERIVTIEDSAELQLDHPHVVSLEARLPNAEGFGLITIRDLVRNSMRMRPDRIVIGEVRGDEALDMLMALNTGHSGSFTTVHANSSREALHRLEMLSLLAASNLSGSLIRDQIAGAFQLIVHIHRTPSGVRRVFSVSEVVGCDSGIVTLQPFVWSSPDTKNWCYSHLPSAHLGQLENIADQHFVN